ncbi:hypothetical protein DR950_03750 [Kitasatospora xanthocidica]|uniref:Uncharacterized protein n=1 Tax=Kitasatospora xanthocidica TaxID=83382 RepID=A0A372ZN88_9ACTN|nr:hypothetical protein DR950_03750 [Kitasatospora xanthocidica]
MGRMVLTDLLQRGATALRVGAVKRGQAMGGPRPVLSGSTADDQLLTGADRKYEETVRSVQAF